MRSKLILAVGLSARVTCAFTWLALLIGLGFSTPSYAENPGDACSPNGAAGVNGVMQMTCTSGVWVLTL